MNIDQFNAVWATLDGRDDHSDFSNGLWRGVNNGKILEGASPAFLAGYGMGKGMRDEAERFREDCSRHGSKGGSPKHRLSHPQAPLNPGLSTAQGMLDQPLTLTTIHNPQSSKPENDNPPLAPAELSGFGDIDFDDSPPKETQKSKSIQEVLDIWNSATAGKLPKAEKAGAKRSVIILARLKESGWLDDFRKAASYVATSDFHLGKNDRSWKADIDYLLQDGKAAKLAEQEDFKTQEKAHVSSTSRFADRRRY